MLHARLQELIMIAAVLSCTGVSFAGAPSAPPDTVNIRVESVLAADTHEGMDKRLASMSDRLRALFDYSTYRLLSKFERKTPCGQMTVFTLPGGRILHVAPHAVGNGMIAMELILFQGAQPVMSTDLKLPNHGVLIIGGPRYQQGMLIVFVGVDSPNAGRIVPPEIPTLPVSGEHP
jgi:hypothetical protein